ncbi:helix-turn-helix domain-containing protein [Clostridium botulinum]|uniref:helix-turn-helix domain-containing protein n=1 Tax=Clostridium botulinum TaxID=1491 RepID=UPI000597E47C|nr:helix-turn-helix domain-containing protein [Clostridium botulinum]KIL06941.1 hypothetical protein SR42_15365 [Clostridium botulinum]MBY6932117.1 hypothetical protein [Clostridium botulinum]MBY6935252.1 hypothetical protein [Clostridium botulinum]NFG20330.1 hypothetical protein [Clostridium botulinum]NFL82112.1 hypothetical protein [Clostridium botulinum]
MNLVRITKERLAYQEANLIDLKECIQQPVTKDCLHYLRKQLEKCKKSIKYYSELLEVLKEERSES